MYFRRPSFERIPKRFRLLITIPIVIAATALVAAVSTPSAHAAITVDPAYTHEAKTCHQLGSSDQNGVFYTTCGNKIYRYDKNGNKLGDIAIPTVCSGFCAFGLGNYRQVMPNPDDVAPSPDGQYLYFALGTNTPRRFVRQNNGTYNYDDKWALKQFELGGKRWTPIGGMIATDGRGDIYVSNGSYWASDKVPTPGVIVKYSPNGDVLNVFGEHGVEEGQWNTNMDIAVSRDGRRVYVGENCGTQCISNRANYQPSRVSRFDYVPGGNYVFTRVISAQGKTNGRPYPYCEDAGATHSAYSLALDAFENLYVTSVSCGYIQQFSTDPDPAKDRFVKTVIKNLDNRGAGVKNHTVGVDWAGRIYASEWGRLIKPKTLRLPATPLPPLPALPQPDTIAPVVRKVTLPATTNQQDVTVTVDATDNVAVAEIRLANEDGTFGPWQPFVSPLTHTLSDGYGVKGVFVQVRDMPGNESNTVYTTLRYDAPAGAGDPDPGNPGGGGNDDGGAPGDANVDIAAPVISEATAPTVTGEREITIMVEATDDVGVTHIRFANEDGNWSNWRAFANANQWTLTPGYLNKVVSVMVRDAAGNESNVVVVRTRLMQDAPNNPPPADAPVDNESPVLEAVTIPPQTTEQRINVKINATDNVEVTQVRFANEDGNWTAWQKYAPQKAWMLSANHGPKLIFVQVRDASGNESITLTATTQYVNQLPPAGVEDKADPVVRGFELPETTRTANITVTIDATDDVGVTEVRFANEDGNWGDWRDFGNGTLQHRLTAGATMKAVFVQVRDAAGRESNVLVGRTTVTP